MQSLSGASKVFLLGNGHKIAEMTKLHIRLHFSPLALLRHLFSTSIEFSLGLGERHLSARLICCKYQCGYIARLSESFPSPVRYAERINAAVLCTSSAS